MSDTQWLAPREVLDAVGVQKAHEMLKELVTGGRPRAELIETIMTTAKCNEYSADDFLTDLVKNPPEG